MAENTGVMLVGLVVVILACTALLAAAHIWQ